jgi:putative DNA primase/helicase
VSNWVNYDDVIAQLQSFGLDTADFEVGQKVRCKADDVKEKNAGWYWLHETLINDQLYLVGGYGYWEGNNNHAQKIELSKTCEACQAEMSIGAKKCPSCGSTKITKRQISDEQRKALATQIAENKKKAQAERNAEIERAAKVASQAYYQLSSEGDCDYLQKKNISKPTDVKYGNGQEITIEGTDEFGKKCFYPVPNDTNTIIIPMRGNDSGVYGLQVIRGSGHSGKLQKEYWPKGHSKKGKYFVIGTPTPVILIAEGFATGMSLHMATNLQVVIAFDAGNIQPVAEEIHKKYKRAKILICADDDYLVFCPNKIGEGAEKKRCYHPSLAGTETCPVCHGDLFYIRGHDKLKIHLGEAGVKAAEVAAIAVGGAWIKPTFPFDRENKKLTDFNDLANGPNCSLSTVKVQIDDKLTALGWSLDVKQKAKHPTQGAGGERQSALSIMELDDAVARFIPLDDGTGGFLFDTRTNKIALVKQMTALLPAGVRWDDVKRHYEWISRGAYYLDEIGFDPTESDKKVKLNTWTGWELKPKQGSCEKLLETLEYLCSKEKNADEVLWWMLKWMAYPLQNPGAKMLSAIILHGPQGTGKSLIFRTLASIYGKYATVIGNRGIEDKFNADWADSKLFILAEEVATSADKWQIKNELKELVTGETVRVNPKNIAAYSQKNQMNLAFLSNEDLPLPIESDDRRHLVVYTPVCLPESHYIDALIERDDGGIEAFYYFLMQIDLTGFSRYTKPPNTKAKDNLIRLSLPSDKRFLKDWLDGDTHWPCVPCLSMDLYQAYLSWCKKNGETRPRPSNQFLGMVNNLTGWQSGLKRIFSDLNFSGNTKPQRVVIPPVTITTGSGEKKTVRVIYAAKNDNENDQQWLTGYVIDFKNAKEEGENNN